MRLKKPNLQWAFKHLNLEGDTDLFPRPFELDVVKKFKSDIIEDLSTIQIEEHTWKGPRRLMVPKGDFSFRQICQLDPLDLLLFAAIIKEIGKKIEKRRIPVDQNIVFSYRYEPKPDGSLYSRTSGWEQFWKTSLENAQSSKFVLVTDINDFYNQIYHHTIENQLDKCGIAKGSPFFKAIKNLLANISEGISRGIPIGPHPAHLLAELSMIPIDGFLQSIDARFCRYADDLHIFFENRDKAHEVFYRFAEYLDKTQKMLTNKQKTHIYDSTRFIATCNENLQDKPINITESELLQIVRTLTKSPYEKVRISLITPADLEKFSKKKINSIFEEYLHSKTTDYVRLRWFIRRLVQVGIPDGIEYILQHFESFLPAISDVAQYFEASAKNYKGDWQSIGSQLIQLYKSGIVQSNEYIRVVILSLFSRIQDINHINQITSIYNNSTPACQRKILLAASSAGNSSWLSSLKGTYKTSDEWSKRAIIFSMKSLPTDEREFWLKSVRSRTSGLDRYVCSYISAKNSRKRKTSSKKTS